VRRSPAAPPPSPMLAGALHHPWRRPARRSSDGHGGGLHLHARRPPVGLRHRSNGSGPGGAPPPPPMLTGAALVCGPWWHFARYLAEPQGHFGTGECGCQTEWGELQFLAPTPHFGSREQTFWALLSRSRFVSAFGRAPAKTAPGAAGKALQNGPYKCVCVYHCVAICM
jgi:hypothetical protein